MSTESLCTGDDAIEEPEPLDEWPREKTEAVGEERWVEEVEERDAGVVASVWVEYEDSMSGLVGCSCGCGCGCDLGMG